MGKDVQPNGDYSSLVNRFEKNCERENQIHLKCVAIISIVVYLLLYTRILTGDDGYGKKIFQYDSLKDMEITQDVQSVLAKIEIIDTYIKNDVQYYEIKTTATGDEIFTYSEKEYDEIFGLGNNAFDCEVYTLFIQVPVIKYESRKVLNISELDYFSIEDLEGYEFRNVVISASESGDVWRVECLDLSTENKNVQVINKHPNDREHELYTQIKERRYSFLGEINFTDNEIKEYQKELDSFNKSIIEDFNGHLEK